MAVEEDVAPAGAGTSARRARRRGTPSAPASAGIAASASTSRSRTNTTLPRGMRPCRLLEPLDVRDLQAVVEVLASPAGTIEITTSGRTANVGGQLVDGRPTRAPSGPAGRAECRTGRSRADRTVASKPSFAYGVRARPSPGSAPARRADGPKPFHTGISRREPVRQVDVLRTLQAVLVDAPQPAPPRGRGTRQPHPSPRPNRPLISQETLHAVPLSVAHTTRTAGSYARLSVDGSYVPRRRAPSDLPGVGREAIARSGTELTAAMRESGSSSLGLRRTRRRAGREGVATLVAT